MANCQNGRKRAKSAKMAGYSKSCAKLRVANIVPKNIFISPIFFV
jgi:hypothetical protein